MHINELPPELLVMIFSKIDDFSQKIGLERVCRHWLQNVNLDWKTTKICLKPVGIEIISYRKNNLEILGLVLNRCGECLEELWLQNVEIDGKLIKRLAKRMKCLKALKLSNCRLDGPAVDSMADLFGQQLYSFILDETLYHRIFNKLIENESSKLDHLNLDFHFCTNYYIGTLPIKLPSSLKSFSLKKFYGYSNSLMALLNATKECKNLKILYLEIYTLRPDIIWAIGNIKSLVYLNLDFDSLENGRELKNVICNELPNLKALRIGGHCSEEMISNIARDRPDLIHLNVFTRPNFQIADSLINSLTLRIGAYTDEYLRGIFLETLLFQGNKSLQHLDIRSFVIPSLLIEKLLEQLPDLKSLHCNMPAIDADLISFFTLIEKNLKKGKNITIYLHLDHLEILPYQIGFFTNFNQFKPNKLKQPILYFNISLWKILWPQKWQLLKTKIFANHGRAYYYKYFLPYDFLLLKKAGWRPNICSAKCENLVLKKVIKEAIGNKEPSFLSEWWME